MMITLEKKKFCLCEAILMQDAKVWKEVRKAWFNVVVEGIMKDYDTKKTLAQVLDLKMTFVVCCCKLKNTRVCDEHLFRQVSTQTGLNQLAILHLRRRKFKCPTLDDVMSQNELTTYLEN